MAIRTVKAIMECDGCGKAFDVRLDPAEKAPNSIADAIDEEIKTLFDCSIQHDLHLCQDCTRKVDSIGDDEYQPTRDEILVTLGAINGD